MNKPRTVASEANSLFRAVLALKTPDDARRFFSDLLTIDEIAEFSKRWQAAKLLALGVPYEKITAQTTLSSTTIARVSRCLAGSLGGYRLVLGQEHHRAKRTRH